MTPIELLPSRLNHLKFQNFPRKLTQQDESLGKGAFYEQVTTESGRAGEGSLSPRVGGEALQVHGKALRQFIKEKVGSQERGLALWRQSPNAH